MGSEGRAEGGERPRGPMQAFRSRIFWKLFGAYSLVILFSSGAVYLVAADRVRSQGLDLVESRLLSISTEVSNVIGDRPLLPMDAAFQREMNRFGRVTGARITIIAGDGVVLADSEEDADRMENHGMRPEVEASRDTRAPAVARRFSRTQRRETMYLSLPRIRHDEVTAYVRTSLPTTLVETRLREVRSNVLLGTVVAAGVALLLGLLLSRVVTRPLERMTHAAEAVARGDYQSTFRVDSSDELGQLGKALMEMTRQLEERMALLTRERNELRAILGSMLEGVIAVDRDERVVHLNGVAAVMLEAPADECVGRRVWEITRIRDLCESLAEVLASDAEHIREVRLSAAPRERVMQIHASPLRDADRAIVGAVVVLHDVTELRRLEVVRREFVANVSHELKTPLTAIRGFVETLLDDEEATPETRLRFLARVRDQSLRLSSLVSDLLVLSRVESEGEALERGPLDLRDPVRQSIHRLSPEALGRRIEFASDLPDEEVLVDGDEEALRQVVDNLLDNALKYTADDGRVSITLRKDGARATIEVSDTGIGIGAEHVDRIFERFYRVDKARSRELGGTGLGLAIVKHIVEGHRGKVSVQSAPGRGSTFRVVIPLRAV